MSNWSAVRLRSAAVLVVALGLGACAGQQPTPTNLATIATPGSPQDFTVNVGDRVQFLVDSSDLTPQGQAILDRQARWLARYPRYTVLIEGHADERGTREYNIGLSARRGDRVIAYLTSRGVPPSRFGRPIAYGKDRPVAVCDDESCWTQNRRAVTLLGGAGS